MPTMIGQRRFRGTDDRLEALGRRPELIILDNLSSLGGGIDENDNSQLDAQLAWLVQLRFRGHSVLIIHHAGKSGDQRGASRREDLLDTTIKLVAPTDADVMDRAGATFEVSFTKTRDITPDPDKLMLSLRTNANEQLEFQFQKQIKISSHRRTLLVIGKGVVENRAVRPFLSQQELALAMNLTKGAVSTAMTKLQNEGLAVRRGALFVTEHGAMLVEKLTGMTVSPEVIFREGPDEPPV